MRILFDQGTPVPLRRHLSNHLVSTAFEMGWAQLANGELLAAAESQFDVLITTDRNLRYQQNLAGRSIAIVILPFAGWPKLQTLTVKIAAAIDELRPGDYLEIHGPARECANLDGAVAVAIVSPDKPYNFGTKFRQQTGSPDKAPNAPADLQRGRKASGRTAPESTPPARRP